MTTWHSLAQYEPRLRERINIGLIVADEDDRVLSWFTDDFSRCLAVAPDTHILRFKHWMREWCDGVSNIQTLIELKRRVERQSGMSCVGLSTLLPSAEGPTATLSALVAAYFDVKI